MRGEHAEAAPSSTQALPRTMAIGIALTALAVLAVANTGIWQKEKLIAEGLLIFVELAPVDPRSLMQGDYMQLRFRMLPEIERTASFDALSGRPHVVLKLDARVLPCRAVWTRARRSRPTSCRPN
ncbi:GDYXXLXY domain-containing protein [Massilia sp. B-10]|nr:GDYXXLXY domain-containing protein [Massilia sp. B-10]